MKSSMTKSLVASGVALALGVSATNAELVTNLGPATQPNDSGNFTMLTNGGGTVGGTNDVATDWDGTGYNASSDYTGPGIIANLTANSTTPFNQAVWTAHDIQVFVPGTYSFDTSLGGGVGESLILNVTVPEGQLGMHMLFDWNGNLNIDVFVLGAPNTMFGAGIGRNTQNTATSNLCDIGITTNCLFDGKSFGTDGKPLGTKVWMLASVDGDGDEVMGFPMAPGGPFQFFNANFNMQFSVNNFPPVAGIFKASATVDQASTIDLLLPGRAEDTDGTVDPASIAITSGPGNGSIVVNVDGTVTYTPDTGFTSPPTDSFQYTVVDDDGSISNVGLAAINVGSNSAPTANPAIFNINEDDTTAIAVTAVATDIDGGPDPLTFNTFDAVSAQRGTAALDGSRTVLTYTPLVNFNGTDTFDFTVTDGADSSLPATITVIVDAVNDAPDCADVVLNTGTNTPLSIDVATKLLLVCTDVDADAVALESTTQPSQPGSTLAFDGSNTLTYTPAAGFNGQDTFTYTATDGAATGTRTVFVNVGKVFGNFTMLNSVGETFGGTNDVVFDWNGNCYSSVAEADAGIANMIMGSDSRAKFNGFPWSANNIKVYCPGGPYEIDTCNPGKSLPDDCNLLTFTVPAGHLGGHMLFNWNGTIDIDVVNVWNISTGATWQNVHPKGGLFRGIVGPSPAVDELYEWISTDADDDGIPGIIMVDGPFINHRANFNFKTTKSATGGPVQAPETSVPSPNLGGCTLEKWPVNLLSRSDWLLVTGFVVWLSGCMRRFRRKGL